MNSTNTPLSKTKTTNKNQTVAMKVQETSESRQQLVKQNPTSKSQETRKSKGRGNVFMIGIAPEQIPNQQQLENPSSMEKSMKIKNTKLKEKKEEEKVSMSQKRKTNKSKETESEEVISVAPEILQNHQIQQQQEKKPRGRPKKIAQEAREAVTNVAQEDPPQQKPKKKTSMVKSINTKKIEEKENTNPGIQEKEESKKEEQKKEGKNAKTKKVEENEMSNSSKIKRKKKTKEYEVENKATQEAEILSEKEAYDVIYTIQAPTISIHSARRLKPTYFVFENGSFKPKKNRPNNQSKDWVQKEVAVMLACLDDLLNKEIEFRISLLDDSKPYELRENSFHMCHIVSVQQFKESIVFFADLCKKQKEKVPQSFAAFENFFKGIFLNKEIIEEAQENQRIRKAQMEQFAQTDQTDQKKWASFDHLFTDLQRNLDDVARHLKCLTKFEKIEQQLEALDSLLFIFETAPRNLRLGYGQENSSLRDKLDPYLYYSESGKMIVERPHSVDIIKEMKRLREIMGQEPLKYKEKDGKVCSSSRPLILQQYGEQNKQDRTHFI